MLRLLLDRFFLDLVVLLALFFVTDFGLVGTLSHPFVTVDLVVSHGDAIVEQDGARGRRRSGRGGLPLEDGTAGLRDAVLLLMPFVLLGIVEDGNDLLDGEPSSLGGSENLLTCKCAGIVRKTGVVGHHFIPVRRPCVMIYDVQESEAEANEKKKDDEEEELNRITGLLARWSV